jgi:hypothetical protein
MAPVRVTVCYIEELSLCGMDYSAYIPTELPVSAQLSTYSKLYSNAVENTPF